MLYTCKCLNILVEADETKVQMNTSSVEENPQKYFTEGAKQVEIRKITKQVDSLVQGRMLKNKTVIYKCLNCCLDCYSLSDDKKTAFVNSTLISDLETVKKLRNDTNFSPAFRIIISTVPEKKQPLVMHKQANAERLQSAVLSLQKQFSDLVQEQIAKTEDRIKTFSEQEHIRLKEYRDRAQRDHKCLIEALYAAEPFFNQQQTTCIAENDSVGSREIAPIEVQSVKNKTETRAPGTITAGSINKEKKPLPQHQHQRLREKNGSFDSEGLFAIEGMEDWPSDDLGKSEGESDTDHDDSGSHDEGIDIHRKKEDFGQLAKSLPVNVPVCSNVNVEFEGEDEPSDAVDIAASIKALARSLHGDAVFGDLPRPRFSTQI